MVRYKLLFAALTMVVIITLIMYAVGNEERSRRAIASNPADVASESQDAIQDPSSRLTINPDDPQYLLRTRGYPHEVPLAQGVEEFNKRAQGNEIGRTQLPMTTEEVIAAIRDWSLKEEPIDPSIFKAFQIIAETETLPRGSYFVFHTGTSGRNGYDIDAWHVYLRLGLDKYPADLTEVPVYEKLIRTQYISSRRTKRP